MKALQFKDIDGKKLRIETCRSEIKKIHNHRTKNTNLYSGYYSRGVALFQVLVMVGIFSTLLLLMSAFTKQSVLQVHELQDNTDVRLKLYSAQNQLLFRLLSEPWNYNKAGISNNTLRWNFHGEPFQATMRLAISEETLQIELQDLNSLLNWTSPRRELSRFLEISGASKSIAEQMTEQLRIAQLPVNKLELGQRIQTGLPHLPFFHSDEVRSLAFWSDVWIEKLRPYMTLHSQNFNPANMPDELLSTLLTPSQVDVLRQSRQEGTFSYQQFSKVTGIEQNEIVGFYPGPGFKMKVKMVSNGLEIVTEANIQPLHRLPVFKFGQTYQR